MIKTITVFGFLSLLIPLNAYAEDSNVSDPFDPFVSESGRIDPLEKEIQKLKLRISKLESLHSNPAIAQDTVISSLGYKSIENWRKLTTDMGYSDVRKILGEPQRVNGGNLAQWYYPNGGEVVFDRNKVWQWREPRE